MRILLARTLQQQLFPSISFCQQTTIQAKNYASFLIHPGRFIDISAPNEFRYFYSSSIRLCSSSSALDIEKKNDLGLEFFDGYYFLGEIPRNLIAYKWSKASGPGGMNVNANPTKAEIRFHLDTADWIPELVRERMSQKNRGNLNSRGEFILTSMRTRSAADNLEDCFEKLDGILREVSLELVKERRREYISPEYLERVEQRKELADHWRIVEKKRNAQRREGRRGGSY